MIVSLEVATGPLPLALLKLTSPYWLGQTNSRTLQQVYYRLRYWNERIHSASAMNSTSNFATRLFLLFSQHSQPWLSARLQYIFSWVCVQCICNVYINWGKKRLMIQMLISEQSRSGFPRTLLQQGCYRLRYWNLYPVFAASIVSLMRCNRPITACGIETQYYNNDNNYSNNFVATGPLPLAVLKIKSFSKHRLRGAFSLCSFNGLMCITWFVDRQQYPMNNKQVMYVPSCHFHSKFNIINVVKMVVWIADWLDHTIEHIDRICEKPL